MIKKIIDYLKKSGTASVYDISLHLESEPEVVTDILKYLSEKEIVKELNHKTRGCTSCSACNLTDKCNFYQLKDRNN